MTNFNELSSFINDMTEEVSGLEKAISYTERFLMDESPKVPQHLAEMKANLTEAAEALRCAVNYRERLAAY